MDGFVMRQKYISSLQTLQQLPHREYKKYHIEDIEEYVRMLEDELTKALKENLSGNIPTSK